MTHKPILTLTLFTGACFAAAQGTPSIETLSKQRLALPITLHYQVSEADARSKAVQEREWDEMTNRIARAMKKEKETPERIAEFREARRRATDKGVPVSRYKLDISLTEDALVYRRIDEAPGSRPLTLVISIGEEKSYQFVNNELKAYNGNWERMVGRIPFPGVGLGSYALVKPMTNSEPLRRAKNDMTLPWAEVAGCDSFKGPITYEWGTVYAETVDGKPRITRIAEGIPKAPHNDWRFSDFKMQDGVWIATRLVDRTLNGNDPLDIRTYELTGMEHAAGPSAENSIRKFIRKGDPVQELDGKGKLIREYLYDPEKGDPFGAAPGMASAILMSTGGLGALLPLTIRLGRRRR